MHTGAWQAAYAHVFAADRLAAISVERRRDAWREQLAAAAERSIGPVRDADGQPPTVGELYAIYLDPAHWDRGLYRRALAPGAPAGSYPSPR